MSMVNGDLETDTVQILDEPYQILALEFRHTVSILSLTKGVTELNEELR